MKKYKVTVYLDDTHTRVFHCDTMDEVEDYAFMFLTYSVVVDEQY